jgi:hypothetical protein
MLHIKIGGVLMSATYTQWWLRHGKWSLPVVLLAVWWVAPAQAQVTDFIHLPWSTSHIEQATVHSSNPNNCKEQAQGDLYGVTWVTCDDLYKGGGQLSGPTYNMPCKITADANMSAGGGGRGIRAYEEYETPDFGPHPGGSSSPEYICGTPNYILSDDRSTLREIWMRFYIRFESGWTRYTDQTIGQWDGLKLLYWGSCDDGAGGYFGYTNGICSQNGVNGRYGSRNFYVGLSGYDVHVTYGNGDGKGQQVLQWNATSEAWKTFGGGSATSDGRWVCAEFYWKADTTADVSYDGKMDFWLNGVNYLHVTNANFRIGNNNNFIWTSGSVINNGYKWEASPVLRYMDVDDIAISNTGRIGCSVTNTAPPAPLSSTPPPAPMNVKLIQ